MFESAHVIGYSFYMSMILLNDVIQIFGEVNGWMERNKNGSENLRWFVITDLQTGKEKSLYVKI